MKDNNGAYIVTPLINQSQREIFCLQFYFQMFGKDTKELNVYITNGSISMQDASLVWSASMNNTKDWTLAFMTIRLGFTSRILFEARYTKDKNGFAIDDINTVFGKCNDSSTPHIPSTRDISTPVQSTTSSNLASSIINSSPVMHISSNVYRTTLRASSSRTSTKTNSPSTPTYRPAPTSTAKLNPTSTPTSIPGSNIQQNNQNGIRNTAPSTKTSTGIYSVNTELQKHRSPFLIPGWFQIIEIGLIAITALVGAGLLGCCCFKFCGGKKEEDEDDEEDEDENNDYDAYTSAWKANHRSPVAKPGGWINGF